MALTGIYGALAREDAVGVLHEALSFGVKLFDTAALYGTGANEELLGDTLGARSDVSIVTKFGLYAASDGKLCRDSRPQAIRQSVEASLRRLKRDRLDYVLQHRSDPSVSFDEVVGVIEDLKAEGKVAKFGVSNVTAEEMSRCSKVGRVAIVQNELSLVTGPKEEELAAVEAAGAVFMAFAPLGRGLVTRSIPAEAGDYRKSLQSFEGPAALWGQHAGYRTSHSSADQGSCARSALDWILGQSASVVAIPGCRSQKQVREIFQA